MDTEGFNLVELKFCPFFFILTYCSPSIHCKTALGRNCCNSHWLCFYPDILSYTTTFFTLLYYYTLLYFVLLKSPFFLFCLFFIDSTILARITRMHCFSFLFCFFFSYYHATRLITRRRFSTVDA